jgi:hypothetical protein
VADIMLPQYARALSAKSAARAIVEAVNHPQDPSRTVTVLGARELMALIEKRLPQLKPKAGRVR